ncbi:hypothetical protein NEOC95_000226 [Neochlamydia sp. AcF95]|nr:hypothetical protein [Neochlamydia sp. AcF95]
MIFLSFCHPSAEKQLERLFSMNTLTKDKRSNPLEIK